MSEKDPLLGHPVDIQQEPVAIKQGYNTERKLCWRYLMFALILFLMLLGSDSFVLICNKWIHAAVKDKYFHNISIRTNFSTCKVVNKSDDEYVTYKNVQNEYARWLTYFRFARTIPAIAASLLWPSLSDFYGRRNFILLTVVGHGVKVCVGTFVIFAKLDLVYMIIVYAIQGASDATSPLSFSLVADITPREKGRALGFIFLQFLILASHLASSPLNDSLVKDLNLSLTYSGVICCGLVLMALPIVGMFLPETLDKDCRSPIKSVTSPVRKMFLFYTTKEFKHNQVSCIVLLVMFILVSIGNSHQKQMEVLYLLGMPFCWDKIFIGYFSLARHAGMGIVGLSAAAVMQRRMSNVAITILSCLSNIGSYITEGLAQTHTAIYCVPVAGLLSFLLFPMVRALLSTMTSSKAQGSLFATLAVFQMLVESLTTFEKDIYTDSQNFIQGLMFLCMAGLNMVAFILLLLFCCTQPQKVLGTDK